MSDWQALTGRAAAMRLEFDAAFAEEVRSGTDDLIDVLEIIVGNTSYGVQLEEVASIVADKAVTPMQSPSPALVGLASSRGEVVAVYDLASLLGEPDHGRPRWMILAAADPSVALVFGAFSGHLRVRRDAIAAAPDGAVLQLPDRTIPIVTVASLLASIRTLVPN